jgi:hypothetical protein
MIQRSRWSNALTFSSSLAGQPLVKGLARQTTSARALATPTQVLYCILMHALNHIMPGN